MIEHIRLLRQAQFSRFAVVGVMNTVVGYLAFVFALWLSGGISWIGVLSANVAGVSNSYLWNSRWTFQVKRKKNYVVAIKFVSVYAFNMLINEALLQILHTEGLRLTIAQVPSLFITTFISYLAHKFWTFR